ncbi:MAG TPA: type II secretion system F family protein [Jiangellaceae bacterium]|nr:type II secretion system F family protein [Jiangellaceae bacterium]
MGPLTMLAAALAAAAATALVADRPPRRLGTLARDRDAGFDVGVTARIRDWVAPHRATSGDDTGLASTRARALASLSVGVGVWYLAGDSLGWFGGMLSGLGVGVTALVILNRAEPAGVVAAREQARTTLPLFVDLVVAAVRAGCPVSVAVDQVAAAVPGPLSSQLASISTRASVSADPAAVWAGMATDPVCGALARAVAGALGRGVSPVATLERVASDARADARWEAEARSRSLGARAAAPLGLCFLPAFVLLGIVPLIASTATSLLP